MTSREMPKYGVSVHAPRQEERSNKRESLPRGDSQSLTHVKLELLEIAGEVCVAMSEQASESIGGLFGQHEPEPFRIFDNRD